MPASNVSRTILCFSSIVQRRRLIICPEVSTYRLVDTKKVSTKRSSLPCPILSRRPSEDAYVVLVSMMFGFFPETQLGSSLYGNTVLQAIFPFMTVSAGLLGFLLASKWHDRDSVWVWIPGVLWFAMGVYETGWQMGAAPSNHISGAVANLFGPRNKCAESECLYELLVTAPLMCSIAYSLIAWLTLRFAAQPASAD
jgi:hypothetical protein